MSEYIHKSHNVTILIYHFVLPAKYRRVVFDDHVDEVLGCGVWLDNLIVSSMMVPWLENLAFIILVRYTMSSFGGMLGRIFFSRTRIVTDFISFWMRAEKNMATVSMHSV